MPLFSCLHQFANKWALGCRWHRQPKPTRGLYARLIVEQLEDRLAPALISLASFDSSLGASPKAGLIEDASGNFFGTTYQGGRGGFGTVFEMKAGSGAVTTLASFDKNTNGANPEAGLVEDASGNLFGTTNSGGVGYGTVFEVKAGSGAITALASFNNTNGANPQAGLVEDGSGNLFGTTRNGGGSASGTVFEVKAGSGAITTLATFNNTNGASPHADLVEDGSGNLFGTTLGGGANGYGTVFEVKAGSGAITTLATFDNFTNGANPGAGLVEDGSGNLFGTTIGGGASGFGTVFEVKAGSGAITTLATFNNTNGSGPFAGLVEDGSGNLFGTTQDGGASGFGTVFEVKAGSGAVTTLGAFNNTNGANPLAGLVEDAGGNLFGTASSGGPNNDGTVFEVKAGSGAITTLASFNTNGANSLADLVEDGSGNLFGTTGAGGANGLGTVFEVKAGSGAITTLASFNGTNGTEPVAGLVEDAGGNLFGTTIAGGANNGGTVFEVKAGSGAITTLASFNFTNGDGPSGSLVENGSGDLFGTTQAGGANNDGTVFEVQAGSFAITTLASFNGTNGHTPLGNLVKDSSGNLFGTTDGGGANNDGTVFELKVFSSTITTLASFNGTNGANPVAGLVEDGSGNLFGTTSAGGANSFGTVFEVKAGSGAVTTLATFNGSGTRAGLVEDGSGNLFGTTLDGGANGFGSVFEVKAGSGAITTLASFNGTNGASPRAGLVEDAGGNLFGTTLLGGRDGDGTVFEVSTPRQTIGVFDPSTGNWYLRNSNSGGAPNIGPFAFGAPGWIAIVGDWNGDGLTTIGVVDPTTETWYLRNSNSPGAPDYMPFQYGAPGWVPVVGDWNGTGHTGIGVFDPSTGNWYLRNEVGPGAPDAGQFQYGGAGWKPVVGDWTGQGKDTIGVVDPNLNWYLRNSNTPGAPDFPVFAYGGGGWTPVVGDWSGQGKDTIGVVDPSRNWYLRNSNNGGAPSLPVFAYGGGNWGVVAGDWDFPALPQLAAGGEALVPSGAPVLTNAQLQTEVQAALNLLAADGVNQSLLAQLASLQFSVGQLPSGVLGLSNRATRQVEISADAAGYGWFVDANPTTDQPAADRMDLLTVVLHEMGHFDGWTELDPIANPDALMALTLGIGQRRIQALDAVFTAGL